MSGLMWRAEWNRDRASKTPRRCSVLFRRRGLFSLPVEKWVQTRRGFGISWHCAQRRPASPPFSTDSLTAHPAWIEPKVAPADKGIMAASPTSLAIGDAIASCVKLGKTDSGPNDPMSIDLYDDSNGASGEDSAEGLRRPFIGILFECCGAYVRTYRHPEQDSYRTRCPRCLREVRVRVAPGGTSARQFRAS